MMPTVKNEASFYEQAAKLKSVFLGLEPVNLLLRGRKLPVLGWQQEKSSLRKSYFVKREGPRRGERRGPSGSLWSWTGYRLVGLDSFRRGFVPIVRLSTAKFRVEA